MGSLRAVIVDDDRLNRTIVAKTLSDNGIETFEAGDANIGYHQVERNRPELIVIDVVLPGELDGVGLCRLLRSQQKDKKSVIVMITASDRKREADRSLAAGADILIGKPFSPRQFWTQVDQLLKERRPAT